MKKLMGILLAVAMIMALAVPAMATGETESAEPTLSAHANDMTYYVGGYGAIPGRYQCNVDYREQGYGYGDWFDISFGDPIVENWPTEAGAYTVTFEKTTKIEGASDIEYTFNLSMNITVLELPATSGKCGDNMTWSFDTTTDTLTISGTGDMYTIAESDEDFQNENFSYKPGWWDLPVRHIIIEEGVENLANYTFTQVGICTYYQILETIQLPTTLEAIPELGFLMSNAMTSLTIPEGITSITGWPFGYPGNSFLPLTELYLPSTLTEMDIVTIILAGYTNTRPITQTLKTIHFAGTEEQWKAINQIRSETMQSIMPVDDETYALYEEMFNGITVVFEPKEDVKEEVTVENGTATVPDSSVEITEGEDVVIDVTDTEEEVSSVVIGSETVDKIADAETSVEIKLPDATVSFDKTAIGSIGTQAGETAVTIVAKEVEDTTLTTEQKVALVEKEVHTILNLEAFAGETKITEFGGGKVTVSVPFELPEGKAGTDYYVAYAADDGTITAMPTTYADGVLSFETTHFSSYVVLENVTVNPPADDTTEPGETPPTDDTTGPSENPPADDTTGPSENPPADDTTGPSENPPADTTPEADPSNPQTGDNSQLMLFVVLMVVSVAGLTVCLTKRRAF